MSLSIREMRPRDYDEAEALWRASPGIGLSSSDSREGVARFLEANPGLSFVARQDDRLVGVVLCGHDGRRGYITHLAVDREARGSGLGRELVGRCLEALRRDRIEKCHLFVFTDNVDARAFWKATGWTERVELSLFSKSLDRGKDDGA